MRLWGYYAWHTFWNTIKKMFRSTFLVIILAIFGFGIIFGLIGGVVGSMVEKQQSVETVESSSEADRVQEEATEEEETQKTPQEIAAIKTYVEAGVMIVFLAILLWGMYSGSKDGTDIFQMADVNLLFTAPMKPQSVLMFRLSFQMVATVFASIYLVFQIPNLVVNMGLGASAVVAIFAGWILLLVFQRLMIVLTYTVCTTHEKLKPYVFPLIVGIVVLLGMIAGGTAAVLLIGGISAYAVWNQKDIGAGEAKKIAYEDAGISESDVERVHVLKDRDDGRLVYEIGFVEADYQYNYEIAASNGKILDKEIEQNNNVQNTQSAAAQDDTQTGSEKTTEISIEQAKQLVLDRVQGATDSNLRIGQEYDDGVYKYEGELSYEGMEYDFEIDANSGTFLEWTEENENWKNENEEKQNYVRRMVHQETGQK